VVAHIPNFLAAAISGIVKCCDSSSKLMWWSCFFSGVEAEGAEGADADAGEEGPEPLGLAGGEPSGEEYIGEGV